MSDGGRPSNGVNRVKIGDPNEQKGKKPSECIRAPIHRFRAESTPRGVVVVYTHLEMLNMAPNMDNGEYVMLDTGRSERSCGPWVWGLCQPTSGRRSGMKGIDETEWLPSKLVLLAGVATESR